MGTIGAAVGAGADAGISLAGEGGLLAQLAQLAQLVLEAGLPGQMCRESFDPRAGSISALGPAVSSTNNKG
ncbi:hypothetical protein [Frankia sp. Cas3]|uniref:hypothetical protein n=1 Tax=Frankia sp. Cas3 TaxID=3073926 RepID=UPI002AD4B99C|nr:hypothetical protein [Frankia sp. Cas3]